MMNVIGISENVTPVVMGAPGQVMGTVRGARSTPRRMMRAVSAVQNGRGQTVAYTQQIAT